MMINQLPVDVIADILSRLPAKALLCLKIVCKSWYDLISDYGFANCHLERSLVTQTNLHYLVTKPRLYLQKYAHLPEPRKRTCNVLFSADFDSLGNAFELSHPFKVCLTGVGVLGSCRGLVLLRAGGDQLLLYNPTTQTYNVLPYLHVHKSSSISYAQYEYGFGYDSVSKDYKCGRIMQLCSKDAGFLWCEVMVYSLESNCWKIVPDVPCFFRPHSHTIGVLIHERCHWVGTNSDDVFAPIVAFSLRDETFSCLPLPNFDFDNSYGLCVGMLDGCLCLLANRYLHCHVLVMKEYGVSKSWTRLFTLEKDQCENLERPIHSLDKKKLLFLKCLGRLAYIDLESMGHTNVVFADWDRGLDVHVYVENLLMLDYAEFGYDIRSAKEEEKEEEKPKLLFLTCECVTYLFLSFISELAKNDNGKHCSQKESRRVRIISQKKDISGLTLCILCFELASSPKLYS